jgi:hypothetical protein
VILTAASWLVKGRSDGEAWLIYCFATACAHWAGDYRLRRKNELARALLFTVLAAGCAVLWVRDVIHHE